MQYHWMNKNSLFNQLYIDCAWKRSTISYLLLAVQRIGVKNRAYCSLLAGSAKTCVVLGWVIWFKKLRETNCRGLVSKHRKICFLALFHIPLVYNFITQFEISCQNWTPMSPIRCTINIHRFSPGEIIGLWWRHYEQIQKVLTAIYSRILNYLGLYLLNPMLTAYSEKLREKLMYSCSK